MLRCPYCICEVAANQTVCPHCYQALPVAAAGFAGSAALAPQAALLQASAPNKESVHPWIWIGNLITIAAGGWLFYTHWQGNTGRALGGALIALAILSLALSRFGAYWKRASCLIKLLILPGVLAGVVVVIAAALDSLSDSGSSHDGSGGGGGHDGGGDGGDFDVSHDARNKGYAGGIKACPYCGQAMPAEAHFCFRCGRPL